MHVLVTGGFGSLGRIVTRRLAEGGHDVTVVTRQRAAPPREPADGIRVRQADLMRDEVVASSDGVDVLIHLAAALGAAASTVDGFAANAVGPLRVLEGALAAGVRRTVFASSMSVYGRLEGRHGPPSFEPIDEEHPRRARTLYGVAKVAAEDALRLRAKAAGHELACVRFSPYFGPDKPPGGRRGLGATLVQTLRDVRAGHPATLPRVAGYRFDPIYAEDAAAALVRAALHPAPLDPDAPYVHVSGGRPTTFEEFAHLVRATWPEADVRVSDDLASSDAITDSCVVFDNRRAEGALGFHSEFDLQDALRHCMDRLPAA